MARSPKALMADSRIPLNSKFLTRIKVSRVPEPLVPLNSKFLTGSSAPAQAALSNCPIKLPHPVPCPNPGAFSPMQTARRKTPPRHGFLRLFLFTNARGSAWRTLPPLTCTEPSFSIAKESHESNHGSARQKATMRPAQ